MDGQQVAFEVAVYTVKDPQGLERRHVEVHRRLAGYDGFAASLALRQADDPRVFADVVLWRDLAAAKAAAAAIGADEALAWFGQQIDELRLFTHFTPMVDLGDAVSRLRTAPLLEIAVYRPADPVGHTTAHRLLHTAKLPGRDGVPGHAALTGEDDGLVGDLIGWSSRQAFESTGEAMMADQDLAAFFTPAAHTLVFALFVPTAGEIAR